MRYCRRSSLNQDGSCRGIGENPSSRCFKIHKVLIPTITDAKKEEEWHCRHDTTIVDIRSGIVGSMSKRAKTNQSRAVNTEYHIQLGLPERNLDHDITIREASSRVHDQDLAPHLQAHPGYLSVSEEEEEAKTDGVLTTVIKAADPARVFNTTDDIGRVKQEQDL